MSRSHWVLVAFVATMVCNGNCRPREVDVKNIYPVYRSEKQLEPETPSRYEQPYKEKRDGDSVTYQRIDIPYKNHPNTTSEMAVKNENKTVIDYIPVALTVKKPIIKIWPSDQNGIESPDDLSLYNFYTNNINPLSHMTTPTYDFPYPPPPKPLDFILEDPTTKRPFYNLQSVYTQPIQVLDRPPVRPHPVHHPSRPPDYVDWQIHETPPPSQNENYVHSQRPTTAAKPTARPPSQPPVTQVTPQPEHTTRYKTTTLRTRTTTVKRKNTRCPNVSITASTSVNNNNSMNKEGCQDITIHINTHVNNSNTGHHKPSKQPANPVVVVQNDPNPPTGVLGVFEVIWTIFTRIFNFSIFNPITTGFSNFFTGISTLFFPWLFPQLLLEATRGRSRSVVSGADNPSEYVVHSSGGDYLKRTRRALQPSYGGWKKISSTPLPKVESEVKSENVSKTQKLNIESIATVARASGGDPPLPSPTAIGQVLDTVSQLVESDIRTPPKLKEIIKEKANEQRKEALGENSTPLPYTFIYDDEISRYEDRHEPTDKLLLDSSEGKASNIKVATDEGVKGIAIPVVMDDEYELTAPPKKLQKIPEVPKPGKDDKKKTAVTKSQPTTTPSSGLSTWILLSDNKDMTTPLPKKNNNRKEEEKKKAGVATTTKKPSKVQATTQKSTTQSIKKVTAKPSNTKKETQTTGMTALEALVKNQKKATTTTPKPKTTDPKKKLPDRLEVAETKNKIEIELPESKTTYTLPPNLQITTADDKSVTTSSTQSSSEMTTQSSVEGTTKKKSTTKKKKKNKNRRKRPADDTGVEAKIPVQPVGSQIYNFLSREIVPTVGLGLIGVALTAGLASFLGYNPFASSTIPLRRTYDTHHGYSPNNYYNYNTDYGDGGQSEEVLFREVLSGMPEDSRYGLTHADATYPDAYKRQDQTYDSLKNPVYPSGTGAMYNDKDVGNYDATYTQDYSTGYGTNYDTQNGKYPTEVKEKYPVYTRETGTSFVYPETTGMTSAEKAKMGDDYAAQTSTKTNPDTIERQPEALYRVASESDIQYRNGESAVQGVSGQNNWHRIGSPMEAKKSYQMLEPGPRSLDLSKAQDLKKRSKRAAESVIQRISRKRTKKENDVENEIDFDDSFTDSKFSEQNLIGDVSTTTSATKTTTAYTETTTSADASVTTTTTTSTTTTEDVKEAIPTEGTDSYEVDNDSTAPPTSGVSVLDVLKRLAQFKLRLGLNFLRSTTDLFSRYLDDIQRRVDESFANTTTTTVQYNRRKSPWSRIFFSRLNNDYDDEGYRRKRSVLEDSQFLGAMLTEEDNLNGRFSKSTKKDLRLSNKIFHQKKNAPKKFEPKHTN